VSADRFRIAGWLLSGLCLAVAAGLILNRNAALGAAGRAEARAASDLESARADEKAATARPKDDHFTCAPRTTNEETAFLLELRRRAHLCGVSITRWNSHATEYHRKDGEPADAAKDAVEGVTKINCELVLAGSYPALRAFLTDLGGADRLFTVSHVDWSRTDAGSELSMSLGRYVAPKTATGAVKS